MGEEDLRELRKDIKSILEQLTALRVELAKDYLTKAEFNDYKRLEATNKWKVATFCVTAGGFVFGLIQWAVKLAGGK